MEKTYYAVVEEVHEVELGSFQHNATIMLDGQARTAYIPMSARNVRAGDSVKVAKNGVWVIVEIITRHVPPAVSAPAPTSPPNASTVSANPSVPTGSAYKRTAYIPWDSENRLREPDSAPNTYTRDYGLSLNRAIADLIGRVTALREMVWDCREEILALSSSYNSTVDRVNEIRSGLGSVNSALGSTMSTVNTNASRLNATVNYASGMVDAIDGVVDVLKDERIVR